MGRGRRSDTMALFLLIRLRILQSSLLLLVKLDGLVHALHSLLVMALLSKEHALNMIEACPRRTIDDTSFVQDQLGTLATLPRLAVIAGIVPHQPDLHQQQGLNLGLTRTILLRSMGAARPLQLAAQLKHPLVVLASLHKMT